MTLELHDNEIGNSLVAIVKDIDYIYQAEQWVIDTYKDQPTVIKWVLLDSTDEVRVWERPVGSLDFPTTTKPNLHRDF